MPSREIKPRMLVKALLKAGFVIKRQRGGSHVLLERTKENKKYITSVSLHSKPMPYGTLRAVLKQAGITFEELDALL